MGGLDWFTAERAEVAANPRALLPTARSVIALGTFYLTDAPRDETTPGDPHGRLSCYAWGDDYHEVIRARLDALAAFIRELRAAGHEKTHRLRAIPGAWWIAPSRSASGLGWYGKNTNILTKGWGSWVFLAEIVTSLELGARCAARQPTAAQCEVCLHACPTNAFVAPYVLDNHALHLVPDHRASRQHPAGAAPADRHAHLRLRHLPGGLSRQPVAGAPIARSADAFGGKGERLGCSSPRSPVGSSPALIPLLELDDEGVPRALPPQPDQARQASRAAAQRLRRAGQHRRSGRHPRAGRRAGDDPEPLVRGHAAWALGRIGGPDARAALESALPDETDVTVQQEIRYALAILA